jgi:hypothetical protein
MKKRVVLEEALRGVFVCLELNFSSKFCVYGVREVLAGALGDNTLIGYCVGRSEKLKDAHANTCITYM